MITGNESAMPVAIGGSQRNGQDDYIADGLSIRQHFAAMAMQGMLANAEILKLGTPDSLIDIITIASVEHADALIKELNK